MEKFFLEVLNDKSNVAQDYESIYIDSNFYIGKKDWFWFWNFIGIEGVRWKSGCRRSDLIF